MERRFYLPGALVSLGRSVISGGDVYMGQEHYQARDPGGRGFI